MCCCVVLCCVVSCCIVSYCSVLCAVVLCSVALCCTILYCIVMYCIVLSVLYCVCCIALCRIASYGFLHGTISYDNLQSCIMLLFTTRWHPRFSITFIFAPLYNTMAPPDFNDLNVCNYLQHSGTLDFNDLCFCSYLHPFTP